MLIKKISTTAISKIICSQLHRCYSTEVRVRFAPSPTGYLHLGGLRTALYNYVFAKSQNGKFILRIEDTDQTRIVEGAAEQLQKDLEWAGIGIDEGPRHGGNYGPYIQSKRIDLYQNEVKTLLKNGSAYYCFCTEKRLNLLRREAVKLRQVPKYDNRCRHMTANEVEKRLAKGEEHCIRFKLTSGCEIFEDMIYGNIVLDVASVEGDPVIIKSDGYPTYHFANVVDDHHMKISHVLRGVEWQVSTPKHILMYRAFDWEPPNYGHLPLLLNSDGTKLSKRQNDIKLAYYRENGIFPEALINFITHSGGGFAKDLERGLKPKSYTLNDLVNQFNIEQVNSHSGKLMPERLFEFNKLELQRKLRSPDKVKELINEVQKLVKEKYKNEINSLELNDKHIKNVLDWSSNRITSLNDLIKDDMAFLWVLPSMNNSITKEEINILEQLYKDIEHQEFEKEKLVKYFKSFAVEYKFPFKKLMKTIRSAISGLEKGPGVAEMFEILGKESTSNRLQLILKNQR